MNKLVDIPLREFSSELASNKPVPGGGGTSALVASLGAALGQMVGNLTLGKEKFKDVEPEIIGLIEEMDKLRKQLELLVDKDAEVFAPLAEAYKMKAETEAEKAERSALIEENLVKAAEAPLEVMEICAQAIELQQEFAEKGSKMAISDAGVGVLLCKAGLKSAALNVYINTASMKDRALADAMAEKADKLIEIYSKRADEVYDFVVAYLLK